MEQWIARAIRAYKSIFEKNNEKEIAISHCALSMVKILNGLSEMEYTEFYKYEKRMLWDAMALFSEQCIEQIYCALSCKAAEKVTEKKKVISDVENSISQMMEVCKNIFDGTANAERQMFQSLPVDTNLYELSPKLCAFYSSILKKVVTLFSENESKYAFVMHPTLRSTIEAKLLLETREKPGKVVIIYISESVIEKFDLVPICLLHEAFHVITRKERNRKLRAINFTMNMVTCMEQFLFHEAIFFENREDDRAVKGKLMKFWFQDILELMPQWKEEAEESKRFYSKNVVNEVVNKIRKCLVDVGKRLERIVFDCVSGEHKQITYSSFQKNCERAKHLTQQIRDNLDRMILGNVVSETASLMMFIYRETYADIACFLTLELSADQYTDAFINSIQFGFDEKNYNDVNRRVREYLVAKTLSDFLPESLKWEKHLFEMERQEDWLKFRGQKFSDNLKKNESRGRQNNSSCDSMIKAGLSGVLLQQFQDYLTVCARDLNNKLFQTDGIDEFRETVGKVVTGEPDDLVVGILSGNVSIF